MEFFRLGLVQDIYRRDVSQIEPRVVAGHEIDHPGELAQVVAIEVNSAESALLDLPTQDLRIDTAEFKVRPLIQVTAENERERQFVVPWSAEQPPKNVLGAGCAIPADVFAYIRVIYEREKKLVRARTEPRARERVGVNIIDDGTNGSGLTFEVVLDHQQTVGCIGAFDGEFGDRDAESLLQRHFINAENCMRMADTQDLSWHVQSVVMLKAAKKEPAGETIEREKQGDEQQRFAEKSL